MNKTTKESPLRYVEKELQLISLDPLAMFDREGIILDVNEATIQATGRTREELIGTPHLPISSQIRKGHTEV